MDQPQGGASEPSPSQYPPENTVIFGSVNQEILDKGKQQYKEDNEKEHQTNKDGHKPEGHENPDQKQKAFSSTCRLVAKERSRIELPGDIIDKRIEYMTEHALIGKFIGFCPTERALYGWIAAKWRPKGDVTLQLGPKGFFTAIFVCLEDKYRVLEGGPYFFNAAGLYLREWIPRFNPDKEDLSWAPVWIRLYSLPDEYWDERILKGIGDGVGEYIRTAEETKSRKYISYARICVFIRLNEALPESITLSHRDEEWTQPLDYEHVPFRCRRCHALGHLFRDCPLNVKDNTPAPSENQTLDGFTKVTNRKRSHKKPQIGPKPQPIKPSNAASKNSFDILAQTSEDQPLTSDPIPSHPSSSSHPSPTDPPSNLCLPPIFSSLLVIILKSPATIHSG